MSDLIVQSKHMIIAYIINNYQHTIHKPMINSDLNTNTNNNDSSNNPHNTNIIDNDEHLKLVIIVNKLGIGLIVHMIMHFKIGFSYLNPRGSVRISNITMDYQCGTHLPATTASDYFDYFSANVLYCFNNK